MQEKITIEIPCTENWNDMTGSKTVRHCSKCRFNVYNFAEMNQDEIDNLKNKQPNICARLYLRPDGTYMTANCAQKRKRHKFLFYFAFAAALPITVLTIFSTTVSDSSSTSLNRWRQVPIVGKVIDYLYPQRRVLMGKMCVPAPTNIPANSSSNRSNFNGATK
jgi:hypothetical protein